MSKGSRSLRRAGVLPTIRGKRRHAAEDLGRFGPGAAAAVLSLIAHMRDPDMRVRYSAALALAKIGPPDDNAILPLVETLVDGDRYVGCLAGVAPCAVSVRPRHRRRCWIISIRRAGIP